MGSSIKFQGVAEVLEKHRAYVVDELRKRFLERRAMGRNDLPDEEIESMVRIAGMVARTGAADGISEAFQLGVNRTATAEDHERPTTPVPPRPKE